MSTLVSYPKAIFIERFDILVDICSKMDKIFFKVVIIIASICWHAYSMYF